MNLGSILDHLTDTFDGVVRLDASGDSYFIVDPAGNLPANRQHPFATVITGDRHDTVSDLDRDDETYRLNIGLTKAGYGALFAATPNERDADGVYDTGFDYAGVDVLMPHPVYGGQHWVCVVNPSAATFATIEPLIAEAYAFALRKYLKQESRQEIRQHQ